MTDTYAALEAGYVATLACARVLPEKARLVDEVARKLLGFLPRYGYVEEQTHVDACWLATVFERESGSRFDRYFGNGDPLDRETVDVPRGRGPWFGPKAWEAGAIDAVTLDRVGAITSMPMFCFQGERWNGFGPRAHGVHTSYLWGGMTPYARGKYVADGRWDPTHEDEQLGIVPVALRMMELQPSLRLSGLPPAAEGPPPAPRPVAHAASASRVQHALNALRSPHTPVRADGNYDRHTERAVRGFQQQHRIADDGIAGPITFARILQALAEIGL